MDNGDRFKRFINGSMTPKEAIEFMEWLAGKEASRDIDDYLSENWNSEMSGSDEYDRDRTYLRVKQDLIRNQAFNTGNNKFSFSFWYKLAAVLFILISCVFYLFRDPPPELLSDTYIIKETSKGQKMTIKLPDYSTVKLNSDSRIIYPEMLSDTIRQVELFGEAFFDIREDSIKPFVVQASGIEMRVLGTSFNIRNYPDNPVSVSLLSGKLQVSHGNQELFLIPGEQAVYEPASDKIYKKQWDYNQDLAWIDGIIYFKNNTFQEVLEKLSSWYGVEFEFEGQPVSGKHYTGFFENESLENVMENLSFSNQFTYEIINNNVTISFN